jgi:hypothetical protein
MGLGYVLQLLFSAKNHKIAYNTTTTKAREKISAYLESSELKKLAIFD